MFYSNSQIKELLICSLCKNILTDPRLVPCGKTFCNKCINPSNDNVFRCLCESNGHEIPKEDFPKILIVNELLSKKPEKVSRGEKADQLRLKLDKIKSGIDDIEKNLYQSEDKIREHCFTIRNEIDLSAETAIQKIQNQRVELLKKINQYEKECLANLQKDSNLKKIFEESIEEIRDFYKKWQISFESHELDEYEVSNALKYMETCIDKINACKIDSDRYLFGNKLIDFKTNNREVELIGEVEFIELGFLTNFSNLSNINLRAINNSNQVTHGIIDMNFINDHRIFICYINNSQVIFLIYDLSERKVETLNQIPICNSLLTGHYAKSIKCTVFKKIIISSIIYDNQYYKKTMSFRINSENLILDKEATFEYVLIDIDMNSEYLYILAKGPNPYEVVKPASIFNMNQQLPFSLYPETPYYLHIYDHHLDYVRSINTKNYSFAKEIVNMRTNDSYIFLFDIWCNVSLISSKDDSLIRKFTLDGTIYSLFNDTCLLAYNSTSKSLSLYDLNGNKTTSNKIDDEICPTFVRCGLKKILLYDMNSQNIFSNFSTAF